VLVISNHTSLVRHSRFITFQSTVASHLAAYLLTCGLGICAGISFADSTKLPVYDIRRAKGNRVFGSLAHFGKTGAGWFFGFKLHLVVNEKRETLGVALIHGERKRSQSFCDRKDNAWTI